MASTKNDTAAAVKRSVFREHPPAQIEFIPVAQRRMSEGNA